MDSNRIQYSIAILYKSTGRTTPNFGKTDTEQKWDWNNLEPIRKHSSSHTMGLPQPSTRSAIQNCTRLNLAAPKPVIPRCQIFFTQSYKLLDSTKASWLPKREERRLKHQRHDLRTKASRRKHQPRRGAMPQAAPAENEEEKEWSTNGNLLLCRRLPSPKWLYISLKRSKWGQAIPFRTHGTCTTR